MEIRLLACLVDRAHSLPFCWHEDFDGYPRREHTMSLWLTIPLGVGIMTILIAVIKRRASGVTSLHIDH